jgi:ankyrin repeat protein
MEQRVSVPLLTAAAAGNVEAVHMLLQHANVNLEERDSRNIPPFLVAAENGHLGVLELLLQAGCSVDAINGGQRTALMLASRNGHAAAVGRLLRLIPHSKEDEEQQLLQPGGAGGVMRVCCIDRSGGTALMHAAFYGFVKVVRLLLSHPAEAACATMVDDFGWTASRTQLGMAMPMWCSCSCKLCQLSRP